MGRKRRTAGAIPLNPDAPAPADLFDEWLDEPEPITKNLPAPGTPTDHCRCDWSYHRGRVCGNPISANTTEQLCTPCLYSCKVEREEAISGLFPQL